MTVYGVTDVGFVRKPLAQIISDLTIRFSSVFGANADFNSDSPFGQIIADVSAMIDEPWQVAEDVYYSFDPDQASGQRLVALCALTGTYPKSPTRSTVDEVAIGSIGSVINLGTQIAVVGGGPVFKTTASGTIAATVAWSSYTAIQGDIRTNVGNIYYCTVPGATATSGGPTGTGLDIIDGSAHWMYLGVGTAHVAIPMQSNDYGAVIAVKGTLTVPVNPVSGVNSFINPTDAITGQNQESDTQLRARRIEELAGSGEGSVESLRSGLLAVSGVTSANVIENPGDVVDSNGLPPHSVECIVLGGSDSDVANSVFTKGAGIQTNGTTTIPVTDSMGIVHSIHFTRPTIVQIYVSVDVQKNANYPSDGDQRVKQALVDYSNGLLTAYDPDFTGYKVGDDIITSALYGPIFDQVAGVLDIRSLLISTSPSPTSSTNIVIDVRSLAFFATANIQVYSHL
jgi:uncharacterized phage protein gp47/JayE